jgi:hypothetical protein
VDVGAYYVDYASHIELVGLELDPIPHSVPAALQRSSVARLPPLARVDVVTDGEYLPFPASHSAREHGLEQARRFLTAHPAEAATPYAAVPETRGRSLAECLPCGHRLLLGVARTQRSDSVSNWSLAAIVRSRTGCSEVQQWHLYWHPR